ncbi:MAG: histidine--tRNA ligase [Candidatus Thermoplasmatota archaeon]|nr:histidine--tRNA ligase [Candidatus Thermoplasmatota archaeon]MEC8609306.1 histidine--tRNA ligase [Candidatus Thermoplasmatota archaeon]
MVQRPRGTRDFGPKEMKQRLAFESLLEEQARRHGFSRVQTPIFESLDLFTAKSGPGVVSQLYAFQDKGERNLTLRPELTAPVMRMVAEELRNETKPLRLSYFGQCFRYEEFKKGRYREFYQYGVELIGATGPLVEAEVIALAINMLAESGLKNWELRIGHVGILKQVLTGIGLSDTADEGEPPLASAMRFLDKEDFDGLRTLFETNSISTQFIAPLQQLSELTGGVETIASARELLSDMDGVSLDALDDLESTITSIGQLAPAPPSLSVNLTVARGLDYYTGTVFEVHVPELGGEGQVLGGGSYKLLHLFGLADLDPCCGFGLGFDRVLLALETQAAAEGRDEIVPGQNDETPLLAMIPFNIDSSEILDLVRELRHSGVRVEIELRSRKIGKAMGWADSIGATYALVIGPRDLEQGQATVKKLADGEQRPVALTTESILSAFNA